MIFIFERLSVLNEYSISHFVLSKVNLILKMKHSFINYEKIYLFFDFIPQHYTHPQRELTLSQCWHCLAAMLSIVALLKYFFRKGKEN